MPGLNSTSLKFLTSINTAENLSSVCFSESLAVYTANTDQEVGKFVVGIQKENDGDSEECVLARCICSVDQYDTSSSSNVTAHISLSNTLLQQHLSEFFETKDLSVRRTTFLKRRDSNYEVVVTEGESEEQAPVKTLDFSFDEMLGVITEAHDLLLQRLMVKNGLPGGELDFLTLDDQHSIRPVRYTSVEPEVEELNGRDLTLFGIKRTVDPDSDQAVTTVTYFTQEGQMIRRTKSDSTHVMKLTDFSAVIFDDDRRRIIDKVPLNWEEDLEMKSKFLDRKEELKADHATYMRRNPELQAIVADFLQFVLFRRPDNVYASAAEYFSAFDCRYPPSIHRSTLSATSRSTPQ